MNEKMTLATDSSATSMPADDGVELALKRYAAILSYLQYENAIYWTRSQHFLFAHAAIFGFFASQLSAKPTGKAWMLHVATSVVALAGLALSGIWWRALTAGDYWINRWQRLLQELEQHAMGDLCLMRPSMSEPKRPRARLVAKQAAILFVILWSIALAYAISCLIAKWQHIVFT
jgi:hypothetical protein